MLTCQKHLFSLPRDRHYLNCAFMGPLPRSVVEAGISGLHAKADPSNIGPDDFFAESIRVRERFARLVNVPDPNRIAIVGSASYGLSTVARNTELARGQNVVVLAEQFPSNVYPWRRLAHERDAELRTVAAPEGGHRGERWNQRLLDAIDRDTALVALPHVHWTDGTRFDLEAVGSRAREVGAAFVIDGTQSVGALPFDVQRIRPDALIVAAYKWLLGPYGIGVAYLGARYDGGVPLEENWINREGSEDFSGLVAYRDEYQPGALRYDVGERSNPILLPMFSAGLELLLEWTPEAIQDYTARLFAEALPRARELGFSVEDEEWRASHLFGLRAPAGLPRERLLAALESRRVNASLRGSALRISPNVYNDKADVEALLGALREAVR